MQALGFLLLEPLQRPQADLEMLADALPVELAGHACELDLAVQRLVGDAQQRAVGHAEAIAVGGDGRRLHVERDGARLRHAPDHRRAADLPVAIVDAGDRAGAHQPLELEAGHARDFADRLLQRDLHLGERRDRDPERQLVIEHVILADIAVGEHVVAEPLRIPKARAVPDHQPGMRPQHRDVIGGIPRVGRTDPDVDQGDAAIAGLDQMKGRHLRHAVRRSPGRAAAEPRIARDHVAGRNESFQAGLA